MEKRKGFRSDIQLRMDRPTWAQTTQFRRDLRRIASGTFKEMDDPRHRNFGSSEAIQSPKPQEDGR